MLKALRQNMDLVAHAFVGGGRARASWDLERRQASDFSARLLTIDRRWPGAGGRSEEAPVFILSAGWRSGSTLVQRLMMTADGTLLWGEPWHQGNIIDSMMDQLRAMTDDWPPEEWILSPGATSLDNQWVANLFPPVKALVDAHYAYFDTLFAQPARALGNNRWGVKEVRFGADHAAYLRWLYPKARIIFLYRNPYDAYASYRQVIDYAYLKWPQEPILTPAAYARLWIRLVAEFHAHAARLDAFLLRYEDIKKPETQAALQAYLGTELAPAENMQVIRSSQAGQKTNYIPKLERIMLRRAIRAAAARYGYSGQTPT
jgi:hypothetical protein